MPQKSFNTVLDDYLLILVAQGNHEAYERLKKRYHCHAIRICKDILKQYEKSGVTTKDLVIVCDSDFRSMVEKYDAELSSFFYDNHSFADLLCEIDDSKIKRKKIIYVKRIIARNESRFTQQESAILNLILDGYSIPDLEHRGLMSISSLYLTFNAAVEKLQKIINYLRNKH